MTAMGWRAVDALDDIRTAGLLWVGDRFIVRVCPIGGVAGANAPAEGGVAYARKAFGRAHSHAGGYFPLYCCLSLAEPGCAFCGYLVASYLLDGENHVCWAQRDVWSAQTLTQGGSDMRRLLTSVAVAVCVSMAFGAFVGTPTEAYARKAAKATKVSNASLDAVLGDLQWGMDHAKVMRMLEEKIMSDYRAKAAGITDLAYADMLMKTHAERVEHMKKSYMPLARGNVATLSVSIVGEEFMPDNNEAMITQREDIATKYYFFHNDALYKIAIVYDSSYLGPVSFSTFVATAANKYGEPADEVWDDDANFLESIWQDKGGTKLVVKNKYASYNTFLMVFSQDSVSKGLTAKHKAYYASVNSGPAVSSAIDALTEDRSSTDMNTVDALLGKSTSVNLLAGLSDDDIAIIEGRTTQAKVEAEKKEKAKREAAARKKNDAKVKQGLEIF